MSDLVDVELTAVAHGGTVVGRVDDKVVFVTGGLPGESARIEITERGKRFDRGHVVEVLRPAAGRVTPPCPIADVCGGCDWQHASPETQRDLKSAVVAEQLRRLAGIEWGGRVEAVGPAEGSRTRMRYGVTDAGRVGLRARRSHDIVPLPAQGCLVAMGGDDVGQLEAWGSGAAELIVAASSDGVSAVADGLLVAGGDPVHESLGDLTFEVGATGFWQVHPQAPAVLTGAVLDGVQPRRGEVAVDLYCGVGLFAGVLAEAGCRVQGVEISRDAVRHARRNVPSARFEAARVERVLRALPDVADVVVLDPPRKGAGEKVCAKLASMRPRVIAYVACDPASLARDLATFMARGYRVEGIRAWDLFPMTHHVECLAILTPA